MPFKILLQQNKAIETRKCFVAIWVMFKSQIYFVLISPIIFNIWVALNARAVNLNATNRWNEKFQNRWGRKTLCIRIIEILLLKYICMSIKQITANWYVECLSNYLEKVSIWLINYPVSSFNKFFHYLIWFASFGFLYFEIERKNVWLH